MLRISSVLDDTFPEIFYEEKTHFFGGDFEEPGVRGNDSSKGVVFAVAGGVNPPVRVDVINAEKITSGKEDDI